MPAVQLKTHEDLRGIPRYSCPTCKRSDLLPGDVVPLSTMGPWAATHTRYCKKCWNIHIQVMTAKAERRPCQLCGKRWARPYRRKCCHCDNKHQRWLRAIKARRAAQHDRVVAYTLGYIPVWPLKRTYDLRLRSERIARYQAVNGRKSMKARTRAKLMKEAFGE